MTTLQSKRRVRFLPTTFAISFVSAFTLALTGDVRRARTMPLTACPYAVGLRLRRRSATALGAGFSSREGRSPRRPKC